MSLLLAYGFRPDKSWHTVARQARAYTPSLIRKSKPVLSRNPRVIVMEFEYFGIYAIGWSFTVSSTRIPTEQCTHHLPDTWIMFLVGILLTSFACLRFYQQLLIRKLSHQNEVWQKAAKVCFAFQLPGATLAFIHSLKLGHHPLLTAYCAAALSCTICVCAVLLATLCIHISGSDLDDNYDR